MKNITTKQYKTNENLAKILGFSGLIPFIIAIITLNLNISKIQVLEIIIVYGYTIITFLGGIYWGVGLNIKNNLLNLHIKFIFIFRIFFFTNFEVT